MKEFCISVGIVLAYTTACLLADDYAKLHQQVAKIQLKEKTESKPIASHRVVIRDPQSHQDSPETYEMPFIGKSIKVSDTLLILLTFAIAWFTRGLLKEETDRSRKELRAYLGIPDPIVERLGDANHFQVQVTVTNTGQTPALRVQRWMLCKLVDRDTPVNFVADELHPARRSIPPDSQWPLRQDFTDWTDDTINAITKREKILWVWGQLFYEDIYGHCHITNFRLRSLAHRFEIIQSERPDGLRRFVMTKGWTLEPDADGNDQG